MKWIAVIAALSVGACRPLRPGETRCVSNAYGVTNCKTGQAAGPPPGWWCTSRNDGFGLCLRQPAQCENWRFDQNAREMVYAPCAWQQRAICGGATCYPNPTGCVYIERNSGRDGNACYPLD